MERPMGFTKITMYKNLAVVYAVGCVGHMIPAVRPFMFALTPLVLLGSGIVILLPAIIRKEWRVLAWVGAAGAVTFILEAVGVATGRVFGSYRYGDVLGPKFFGVPFVISFNWVIVLYGGISSALLITKNRIIALFIATLLPVLLDLILEPVAMSFTYWHWENGTIPLQNYIAWGIISFFFSSVYLIFNCGFGHTADPHNMRGAVSSNPYFRRWDVIATHIAALHSRLPAYYFWLLFLYFSILCLFTLFFL